VGPGDFSYALTAAFPWFRPTVGIGLTEGVSEVDAAAAFEIYAGNFSRPRGPDRRRGHHHHPPGQLLGRGRPQRAPHDRLAFPAAKRRGRPWFARWAADQGLGTATARRAAGRRVQLDPLLRDLAAHSDKATARSTAKNTEYPAGHLQLAGRRWPWRPTILFALTIAAAIGLALLPAAARRYLP
jgi:hypothetical protein